MSGPYVVAAYRPRPGRRDAVLALVDEHLPLLRRKGLATDAPGLLLETEDGALVEIFQWVSEEAAREAHLDPDVGPLWDRFGRHAQLIAPGALEGLKRPFAHLRPVVRGEREG